MSASTDLNPLPIRPYANDLRIDTRTCAGLPGRATFVVAHAASVGDVILQPMGLLNGVLVVQIQLVLLLGWSSPVSKVTQRINETNVKRSKPLIRRLGIRVTPC